MIRSPSFSSQLHGGGITFRLLTVLTARQRGQMTQATTSGEFIVVSAIKLVTSFFILIISAVSPPLSDLLLSLDDSCSKMAQQLRAVRTETVTTTQTDPSVTVLIEELDNGNNLNGDATIWKVIDLNTEDLSRHRSHH